MKVSALWITKNEEANIGRSITSVLAVSDEVVVVDTGSTDATIDISRGLGARIETFEWINDFSAARNDAMRKVDGDIILFMDADEWFEPALTKADRARLEQSFAEFDATHITVRRENIDPDTGLSVSVDEVSRILKGGGAFVYEGVIHEHPEYQQGELPRQDVVVQWCIRHNGYNRETINDKLARNLELLKNAVQAKPDDEESAANHVYLVREQYNLGRYQDAFEDLRWLLDRPGLYRQTYGRLGAVHLDVFMIALKLCAIYRSKVSRKQVWDVLVEPGAAFFADNPLSCLMPMMYRLYFDNQAPVLLAELEPALEKAEQVRQGRMVGMDYYYDARGQLYTAAGAAHYRRGKREAAFDYATKALQNGEKAMNANSIGLLLQCTKGLPYADVIRFLSQVLPTDKRGTQEMLLACCQYEGYQDLYTYYSKQALDAGWAKKMDFWYLLVVLGKYEEAAQAAFAAAAEENREDVQRALFLAIACGGNAAMLQAYRGQLGRYEGILESYFGLQAQVGIDFGAMARNYQLIAFAAGRQRANETAARIGRASPRLLAAQVAYYMQAGLYAELLAEILRVPQDTNAAVQGALAECEMMIGRGDLAYNRIEITIENAMSNDDLFNLLDAIAVRAYTPALREAADTLHNAFCGPFEEMIDWQDVVNTGYLPGEEQRKARKALASLGKEQLLARIEPAGRLPMCNLLSVARKAAMVYLERGFYIRALDCLCRVLQYQPDNAQAYAMLEQVFIKLGNTQLAAFAATKKAPINKRLH